MKKIVRGNDFTMRVPVRRIVNGEKERFPLPACEEIEVNLVNAFRRRKMEYTIGVEDDSLLEVRVQSSEMALGAYALEVKGKLFGCSWRSNEYEQIMLVDNNASGDTEFDETDEGEDSVEMDTALVVLAPVTVIDGNFEVLKNEIANSVRDGKWLPLKRGRKSDGTFVDDCVEMGYQSEATGYGSTAMGYNCKASGNTAHAENAANTAAGDNSHAEGNGCSALGENSHAEGKNCYARGKNSHAEGFNCDAAGHHSHVEGIGNKSFESMSVQHIHGRYNIMTWGVPSSDKENVISEIGIGTDKNRKSGEIMTANGDKYLIGVGGWNGYYPFDYHGSWYKSTKIKTVQEVFADLEARITAIEKRLADTMSAADVEAMFNGGTGNTSSQTITETTSKNVGGTTDENINDK